MKTVVRCFMLHALYLLGESQVPRSQEENGPSSSLSNAPTPTTAPSTTEPSTTALSTTAPSTTAPSTTVPSTRFNDGVVPPAGGSSQTPPTRRDVVTARKKGDTIHNVNVIVYYRFVLHAGLKRKHDVEGVMESVAKIFAAADERAAEREESMRKFEMEMEERRAEREDRQEERMMLLLTRVMHPMTGSYMHGPPVQHVMNFPPPGKPSYFDTQQPGNDSFADDD